MSDVHTCGYYCDRPRCIKEQRDELRDRFQIMQAQAEVDAKAQRKVQAQAVNQQLLEALNEIAEWTERYTSPGHPVSTVARKAIAAAQEQSK